MLTEFETRVKDTTYVLKRMHHPEVELIYHVHFDNFSKHCVFRMRKEGNSWKIIPMPLPSFVIEAESALSAAIERNETE